jgi:hypothetical protein
MAHWQTYGVGAVWSPTPKGFRLYVTAGCLALAQAPRAAIHSRRLLAGAATAGAAGDAADDDAACSNGQVLTPAMANSRGWTVSWVGSALEQDAGTRYGSWTAVGTSVLAAAATFAAAEGGGSGVLRTRVDTAASRFEVAPAYVASVRMCGQWTATTRLPGALAIGGGPAPSPTGVGAPPLVQVRKTSATGAAAGATSESAVASAAAWADAAAAAGADQTTAYGFTLFVAREKRGVVQSRAHDGPGNAAEPGVDGPPSFPEVVNYIGFRRVDCRLSAWTAWTSCSRVCGGGSQTKQRAVLERARGGGRPCDPKEIRQLFMERRCNQDQCVGEGASTLCGRMTGGSGSDGSGDGQWFMNMSAWMHLGTEGVYAVVDASDCAFQRPPAFIASVVGGGDDDDAGGHTSSGGGSSGSGGSGSGSGGSSSGSAHWRFLGACVVSVSEPTCNGFRLLLTHPATRAVALLRAANTYRWRVSWVGDTGRGSGRTALGNTRWQPVRTQMAQAGAAADWAEGAEGAEGSEGAEGAEGAGGRRRLAGAAAFTLKRASPAMAPRLSAAGATDAFLNGAEASTRASAAEDNIRMYGTRAEKAAQKVFARITERVAAAAPAVAAAAASAMAAETVNDLAWNYYVDVDTSLNHYSEAPVYFTSLLVGEGGTGHWHPNGAQVDGRSVGRSVGR